ncbi:MAG: ATP-binding cassette domain-containing protein [Bacteroidota bacterium]
MTIELQHVSKSFGKQAVISDFTHTFLPGQCYAVTGPNGSGKSTLLKLIAGFMLPGEGKVIYNLNNKNIPDNEAFTHIAVAAPYLELIEEFSLQEMIRFHFGFKPLTQTYKENDLFDLLGYPQFRDKILRDFSSGMKQRVKLLLALLSEVPVILLDEPCTNLDQDGIDWYINLTNSSLANRLIIIFSNDKKYEFPFCSSTVRLSEYGAFS